jgi:hypothetical protein
MILFESSQKTYSRDIVGSMEIRSMRQCEIVGELK